MTQKTLVAPHQSEETVCAERLHQALYGAKEQLRGELTIDRNPVTHLELAIILNQLSALVFAQIDIGIIEQRRQIVFGQAGTHSLEIDQVSLAVANDDVLRLKIAMDQHARESRQRFGDFAQRWQCGERGQLCLVDLEIAAEAVFEEITLLPAIECGVKFTREFVFDRSEEHT